MMSINEIYNQKILELISFDKCDLSNSNLQELDENIFNFTNIKELILNFHLQMNYLLFNFFQTNIVI